MLGTIPLTGNPRYTADARLDIHDCAHWSFKDARDHCQQVETCQRGVLLSGFACPTLREQVHHVLGAERYWLEVLRVQLVLFNDLAAWPDLVHSRACASRWPR